MSSNIMREIINTLDELERMHQLNYELLEQLNVACEYLQRNYTEFAQNEKLASLLSKALALLSEIRAKEPKTLQYLKVADEKKHLNGTDEEVPVPQAPPRRTFQKQGLRKVGQKIRGKLNKKQGEDSLTI